MLSQILPLLVLATPLSTRSTDLRVQPDDDTAPATDTAAGDDTTADATTTTTDTTVAVAVVPVVVRDDADNGRIHGRHRLHIDTDAFAWRRRSSWTEEDSESKVDSLNLLGGAPAFGTLGAGPAGNVTLGYGYGVAERVIVGARLGLGWQRLKDPDADGHIGAFAYSVVPYFEFVFRPGRRFRPYLGARVGFGGASITSSGLDGDPDVTSRTTTIGPTFGASAGFHAFVTERVSFDAALAFDYALAFGRQKISGGAADSKSDFEKVSRMPNVALMVGLSVWLGRDHSRMDRRDDDQ